MLKMLTISTMNQSGRKESTEMVLVNTSYTNSLLPAQGSLA